MKSVKDARYKEDVQGEYWTDLNAGSSSKTLSGKKCYEYE